MIRPPEQRTVTIINNECWLKVKEKWKSTASCLARLKAKVTYRGKDTYSSQNALILNCEGGEEKGWHITVLYNFYFKLHTTGLWTVTPNCARDLAKTWFPALMKISSKFVTFFFFINQLIKPINTQLKTFKFWLHLI